MRVRVEFTVEPFREGELGSHVSAAIDSLRSEGFTPDVGPFGSAVEGEPSGVFDAIARAASASFEAGATAITLSARALQTGDDDTAQFLAAVRPVARALGASVIAAEKATDDAVALVWKGRVVGAVRPPRPSDLRNGLANLVTEIEAELGGQLAELGRVEKQRAVRMLDERGAFAIRNAVDEVADAMGVSRVTIYNYLNATRAAPE
jgi:uncharacterized protein YqgV (UPF0045/DUF77 family)